SAEEGPPQRVGEEIVEEEVDLTPDAHVFTRPLIDGHDCLDAQLEVRASPDDARIHGAGGFAREAAGERVVDGDLDQGNKPIQNLWNTDMPNERLEVGETVHDGKAPVEDVGVLLDLDVEIAVVIRHEPLVAAPARKHAFDDAGDGSGLEPPERVGQVAHTLAE